MQQSITKRLLQYGASIPVLFGAQVAQSQIILHHADPAIIGTEDMPVNLDFNDDGFADMSFYFSVNLYWGAGSSFGWHFDLYKLKINPGVGNIILEPPNPYIPHPETKNVDKLNYYFLVSSEADWYNADSFIMVSWRENRYNVGPETNGCWLDMFDTAFVGAQLYFDGDFHYGWVRLSVDHTARTFTITDYAVNMMPDAGIYTGLTDGNYTLEAFSADHRLYIFAPPAFINRTMQLRITDLNGRVLINEPVMVEDPLQFILPDLASGQYIVTLSDDMFMSSVPFFFLQR